MGKIKDLTGQTFGLLYVIERAEDTKPGRPAWHCQCECGNITIAQGSELRSGKRVSCGCFAKEKAVELAKKYGQDESAGFINGVLAKFVEKA